MQLRERKGAGRGRRRCAAAGSCGGRCLLLGLLGPRGRARLLLQLLLHLRLLQQLGLQQLLRWGRGMVWEELRVLQLQLRRGGMGRVHLLRQQKL
eukprot:gene44216-23368_t